MGTYDELMQLGKSPKKARPPKPKPGPPKVAVSPIPEPGSAKNKVETPGPLGESTVSKETGKSGNITPPRYHATVIPRNRATTLPRYHHTMIETIRAAVKEFGKEAATHRFKAD